MRAAIIALVVLWCAAASAQNVTPPGRPFFSNTAIGAQLVNPVTGTCATTNAVAYFSAASVMACNAAFGFDPTLKLLTLSANQNASTQFTMTNTTNGTASLVMIDQLSNTVHSYWYTTATGYTGSTYLAGKSVWQATGGDMLVFAADHFAIGHNRGVPADDFVDDVNGHIHINARAASNNAGASTCTAITVSGNDVVGSIIATCGVATVVALDFGSTYTSSTVKCQCTQTSGAGTFPVQCPATTSRMTMTSLAGTSGGSAGWNYFCVGIP